MGEVALIGAFELVQLVRVEPLPLSEPPSWKLFLSLSEPPSWKLFRDLPVAPPLLDQINLEVEQTSALYISLSALATEANGGLPPKVTESASGPLQTLANLCDAALQQ